MLWRRWNRFYAPLSIASLQNEPKHIGDYRVYQDGPNDTTLNPPFVSLDSTFKANLYTMQIRILQLNDYGSDEDPNPQPCL